MGDKGSSSKDTSVEDLTDKLENLTVEKKIKNLQVNKNKTKNDTYSVRYKFKDFEYNNTFKYKEDALAKIKEINNELTKNKGPISDQRIIVSEKNKFLLTKYKWTIDTNNYARTDIDGIRWSMHRYIKIVIDGNNLTSKDIIDHKNGICWDNTDDNLIITDAAGNAHRKLKQNDTTSIYYGVSKVTNESYFRVQLRHSGLNLKLNASFKNELHCAFQYDEWINEYNLTDFKYKNNIEKPNDFIPYVKKEKDLPKNITRRGDKFRLIYKKYNKTFKSLNKAIKKLKILKDAYEIKRINIIKSQPIKRNKDDYAIIAKKYKDVIVNIIVDDNDYYRLLILGCLKISYGYASILIDNKQYRLHRYIMNYSGDDPIDHINNNPLDNRKCNLRIVSTKLNNQNKVSAKNSSSKYLGVCFHKKSNKWISYFKLNNKSKHLGLFENEDEAAIVRDIAILEYYENGNYNYNFPIEYAILYKYNNLFD